MAGVKRTSFSKDNQPNSPRQGKRGPSVRTKILSALERAGKTEEGFYDLLVTRAMDPKDQFSFKELFNRLAPIPKATAPLVEFEFPEKAAPHIQASHVLAAIAEGQIPADIGNVFIQSIKAMIDIEEYTDLKDRIEKIETSLGVTNG